MNVISGEHISESFDWREDWLHSLPHLRRRQKYNPYGTMSVNLIPKGHRML